MKQRFIKWGLFLKANWYAALLSVVCVLVGTNAVEWDALAVVAVAGSAFGFILYKIAK